MMSNTQPFPTRFKEETQEVSSSSSDESREEYQLKIKGKYSAERLMMMLDKEKLEALEEEFNDHPDGIELHSFVWLMKCAMAVSPEEKAELVLGLYYLFQEIDINGDEHMEWSEFTQYIIDAVMGQQSKERSEDKELTPAEIMELAHSHKSRRYQLSKLVDRSLHTGIIRQISYYPSLDLIPVVEMGSPSVRLYNVNCEVKFAITPPYSRNAFVLAAAYSEKEYLLVIIGSDNCLHVYEKDGSGFRFFKSFQTECTHLALWYFEEHKAWVSACDDFTLRQWNVRNGQEVGIFKGHTNTIMDAIEILNPLCIASASMDGCILLWDVAEQKNIGVLTGKHALGVRNIDYSPDYGGNIVSVGYERDIHVWSPEVSISKCYTGKLEGHNCPVVSCKFFRGRPVCVSVDEKGNVRLWDVREFLCLQIISHDRGKIEVAKLLTVTKHDKFVVAGRRLIWYELHKESAIKTNSKDVSPVYADFNSYYLQFVVVTKYDIRIYDSITGKLKKIYTEVQDPKTESELTAFSLDHRHRIFIVGDNSGSVRAYNFSNGALMKVIQGDTEEHKNLNTSETEESPQPASKISSPKAKSKAKKVPEKTESEQAGEGHKLFSGDDWNSEISSLCFCMEDKILIASSWDSTIRVYDMQSLEESSLLRVMTGGHQGSDITCLTYSSHLSLLASGSSNGIVAVWDFEMGKLEAACIGHTKEITAIVFIEPYPIMVTASCDNTIRFWAVRPHTGKMRYQCFMKVINRSWGNCRDIKTPTSVFVSVQERAQGMQRYKRKKHFKVPKKGQPEERLKTPGNPSSLPPVTVQKPKEIERTSISGNRLPSSHIGSPRDSSHSSSDQEIDSDTEWVEEKNAEMIEDPSNEEVKKRCYLYMGDNKGYIKIWSLDWMIARYRIIPLERSERDKPSYNPRRKDEKNAESDVKFWIKEAETMQPPELVNPETDLLAREWKAHNDSVTCLKLIIDPKGLLSCSGDKTVKIWNREGEPWGLINLNSPELPKKWYFPFDWEAKRQADIQKVIEVLSLIDEKVDIDPKTLPVGPTPVQTTRKTRRVKGKKPKARPQAGNKKLQASVSQGNFFSDEYQDDDLEEINEKPQLTQKKYAGSTANLKKLLDEEDEKRFKEITDPKPQASKKLPNMKRPKDINFDDISKKLTLESKVLKNEKGLMSSMKRSSKNKTSKEEEEAKQSRKLSATQSNTNLAAISKLGATKSSLKTDVPLSMDKAINAMNQLKKRRPILGYNNGGLPISNVHERVGGEMNRIRLNAINKQNEMKQDVRYRPGESIRLLNRAISSQILVQTSVLSPYTEDIETLQKKNEILRKLGEPSLTKKAGSSMTDLQQGKKNVQQ